MRSRRTVFNTLREVYSSAALFIVGFAVTVDFVLGSSRLSVSAPSDTTCLHPAGQKAFLRSGGACAPPLAAYVLAPGCQPTRRCRHCIRLRLWQEIAARTRFRACSCADLSPFEAFKAKSSCSAASTSRPRGRSHRLDQNARLQAWRASASRLYTVQQSPSGWSQRGRTREKNGIIQI